MRHRRSIAARLLAPVALLAVAGAVYLIVHTGLQTGSGDSTTTTTTTAAAKQRSGPKKSTYTVRPGDTLTVIAERVGVSLERLQELNPTLDANQLHAGDKLRLKPRT